jgi:hypothetical protein
MTSLKHVGRIVNTGQRCVVVFREMYDAKGEVVDKHNCLVFESQTLPDSEHQDLMRIIESEGAQSTGDLFNVLSRERLGNGQPALTWLNNTNRLRKFPTDNVELTPDARTVLGLNTLNKIVDMQAAGLSQADIENALQNDTDSAPRTAEPVADIINTDVTDSKLTEPQSDIGVLGDAEIAKNFLGQAVQFEAQAKDLREQAIALDPSLKPKRGRPPAIKKSANT